MNEQKKEQEEDCYSCTCADCLERRRAGGHCYLVVHNITKKANVKSLLRSCIAFGAEPIIVGLPTFSRLTHVPHELDASHTFRRFDKLRDCVQWLRAEGVSLSGVEICDGAKNVEKDAPFSRSQAFMLGSEGAGMSESQKAACDSFTIISQHGGGTASLNVAVAGSIILQRYDQWRDAR
jgi:tRNA G18 (ribose-2'-O)-methylase SpoU